MEAGSPIQFEAYDLKGPHLRVARWPSYLRLIPEQGIVEEELLHAMEVLVKHVRSFLRDFSVYGRRIARSNK